MGGYVERAVSKTYQHDLFVHHQGEREADVFQVRASQSHALLPSFWVKAAVGFNIQVCLIYNPSRGSMSPYLMRDRAQFAKKRL